MIRGSTEPGAEEHDLCKRRDFQLLRRFTRHHDQSRSSIVQSGCVAGRNRAVFLENRFQLGERLHRSTRQGVLIGIKNDYSLFGFDFHGDDLILEPSLLNGLARPLVAHQRKRILLFAADLVIRRNIFRRYPHVITHELTNQPTDHQAVDHLLSIPEAVSFARAHQEIWSVAHALDSDYGAHIALPEHDVLRKQFGRTH